MPAATTGHRPHGVRARSQRYWSNSKGSLRGKPQLRVLKQLVTEAARDEQEHFEALALDHAQSVVYPSTINHLSITCKGYAA